MTIKFGDVGRKLVLDTAIDALAGAGLYVGLYTADYTPAAGDDIGGSVAGNEAAYSGYARLATSSWSAAADPGTHAAKQAATCLFFPTVDPGGTVNVYGYFLVTSGGGYLAAERFADAPRALAHIGDVCPVVPRIDLEDQ